MIVIHSHPYQSLKSLSWHFHSKTTAPPLFHKLTSCVQSPLTITPSPLKVTFFTLESAFAPRLPQLNPIETTRRRGMPSERKWFAFPSACSYFRLIFYEQTNEHQWTQIDRLVVRWVTTSESWLLYVLNFEFILFVNGFTSGGLIVWSSINLLSYAD